jgi:hypothetical protein
MCQIWPGGSAPIFLSAQGCAHENIAHVERLPGRRHELRERSFAAPEHRLTPHAVVGRPLDDRVRAVPLAMFGAAAACLIELGWLDRE